MGNLIPGVAVTYETVNGVVCATQNNKTTVVGYKFDPRTNDGRPLHDHLQDSILWREIRQKANTHEGLKAELDRVVMFYNLIDTKQTPNSIMWHPV